MNPNLFSLLAILGIAPLGALSISCGASRTQTVCAEFVTPYSYNAHQWEVSCGLSFSNPDLLIASNAVTTLNASLPGCGYPGYYTPACCASWNAICSVGVDCDVQTARPVPYGQSVMPTGWNLYSTECAVDPPSPNSVLLSSTVRYDPGLLPYYCVQSCDSQGYRYAGVEFGDQCWCGHGVSASVQSAPLATECNYPCAGGNTYSCGAYQRIQLFWKP